MTERNCHITNIYLDNNATTQLEPEVINTITFAATHAWGNPSSTYKQGTLAKELIQSARHNVGQMIGGGDSDNKDIIFTSGGTEANHLALRSAIKLYKKHHQFNQLQPSYMLPHVVTSNIEHDSVKLLLQHWQKHGKIELTEVEASYKTASVEVNDIIAEIRPNTCLVTIMLANNETGVLQPVHEIFSQISAMKRQRLPHQRIMLHTDAAQALGKLPVDIHHLAADYLTIVGHKFYGPRIGALYVRDLGMCTTMFPLFHGGGQEAAFRPGTENTPMIAGLGEAAKIVIARVDTDEQKLRELRDYLETRLEQTFDRVSFNGRRQGAHRLPNTCNVSILDGNLKGNEILSNCCRLQASVGAACHDQNRVSPILLAIGIPEDIARSAIRLSVGRHTTMEDIDVVIDDLKTTVEKLSSRII